MSKQIKIPQAEIKDLLDVQPVNFPKYSTQILNLANQNAQGARPSVVGQMSELIQEFSGKSIKEWEQWYLDKHPNAIENASKKIKEMVEHFKNVITQIDDQMIRDWVKDLVIIKTYIGLNFQEAILKKISQTLNSTYRLSTPDEESKGIDGFIGDIPVSIKPDTYKSKMNLQEKIEVKFIYYTKAKDGIVIDYEEI